MRGIGRLPPHKYLQCVQPRILAICLYDIRQPTVSLIVAQYRANRPLRTILNKSCGDPM